MGTVLIITLGVGWAVDRTMRRVDAAHPETPLSHLPRRCRVPFQLLLLALLSLGGFPAARIGHGRESGIERALAVVLIASLSPDWLRREHPYALPRLNTAHAPGAAARP